MAEELAKKGHVVNIICFKHNADLPRTESINGVTVNRVNPDLRLSKGFLGIGWILNSCSLVKNTDAVVVNLPQFEGFITAIIARIYGKKVICVYHCEIDLPPGIINKCIQKILEGANILSLSVCHTIVVYTRDYAENSQLLKPFRFKTVSIYPPVSAPVISNSVQNRLEKLIGKRDITIGVAARLAREKGLEYLFEAIPKIISNLKSQTSKIKTKDANVDPKLKIVIAGPVDPVGEESYKSKIMNLVRKYQSNIIFLGTLSQDEIGAFYALLDVLVLPSINSTEAFGLVQVESMLCKTPVVASDLPGVRIPITATGYGKISKIKSPESIAGAVAEVIRIGIKPEPDKVRKIFNLEKTVAEFEKLLK
jgi:glycosyltransferase involved in cell wall biosynthesis